MTQPELEDILYILKNGKYWQLDTMQGFTCVFMDSEKLIYQKYQRDPQSGETSNERKEIKKEDLAILWESWSKEEVLQNLY